jgi:hypothetical protein
MRGSSRLAPRRANREGLARSVLIDGCHQSDNETRRDGPRASRSLTRRIALWRLTQHGYRTIWAKIAFDADEDEYRRAFLF